MAATESILDRRTGRVIGYVSARRDILGKFGYYDQDKRLLGGRSSKREAAKALRERMSETQSK